MHLHQFFRPQFEIIPQDNHNLNSYIYHCNIWNERYSWIELMTLYHVWVWYLQYFQSQCSISEKNMNNIYGIWIFGWPPYLSFSSSPLSLSLSLYLSIYIYIYIYILFFNDEKGKITVVLVYIHAEAENVNLSCTTRKLKPNFETHSFRFLRPCNIITLKKYKCHVYENKFNEAKKNICENRWQLILLQH